MKKVKFLSRIILAAGFGLALAFTFSCSDDDGGGWLTCKELYSIFDKCESKYEAEENACKNDKNSGACYDAVEHKLQECVEDGACNGTSKKECESYYESKGCDT